jgi:hypothetical protein
MLWTYYLTSIAGFLPEVLRFQMIATLIVSHHTRGMHVQSFGSITSTARQLTLFPTFTILELSD